MASKQNELTGLKSSINRVQRGLNKAIPSIENLLAVAAVQGEQAIDASKQELEQQLAVLIGYQKRFDEYLFKFEQKLAEVDDALRTDDTDKELDEWSDLSNRMLELVSRSEAKLKALSQLHTPDAHNPGQQEAQLAANANEGLAQQIGRLLNLYENHNVNQPPADVAPVAATDHRLQLPKLELPKFDGDLLKWKPFWDRFEASVDSKTTLPSVDKFSYLIGQLEGEALKCISSLPVTNDNYPVAQRLLKERFGRPQTLISSLYRNFNDLKTTSTDPVELRRFCSEIECLFGGLEALGQDTSGYHLVSMVLAKLPQNLVFTLETAKPVQEDWTVQSLRKHLTDYVARIESTTRTASSIQRDQTKNYLSRNFTAEALFVSESDKRPGRSQRNHYVPTKKYNTTKGTGEQTASKDPTCVFCNGKHFSDECKRYPSPKERRQLLKDRCSNCLAKGHCRNESRSKKPCFHCKMFGNHHSSLCYKKQKHSPEQANIAAADVAHPSLNEAEPCTKAESVLIAANERVLLQTATAAVENPTGATEPTEYRLLLDTASSRSYVTEDLAKTMKLRTKPTTTISVNRFGSDQIINVPTKFAELDLVLKTGRRLRIGVTVVKKITGNVTRIPVKSPGVERISRKLPLADKLPHNVEFDPIHFLVGNDHYLEVVTGERLEVQPGLFLLGSELGWILTGRVQDSETCQATLSLYCQQVGCVPELRKIHKLEIPGPEIGKAPDVADMWTLEAIGIKDTPAKREDIIAVENFDTSVTFDEGRYYVTFPWRENAKDELPDNYGLALGRLTSLLKRLRESPDLLKKYDAIFEEQLKKGVIEKVDSQSSIGQTMHYLPHHPVVTPNKTTTKVRVVYDGSAESRKENLSLNECILPGPVLLENLSGLLIRFRLSPIAVVSDLEKAFLQVGLQVCDRDVTRFIWMKDPAKLTLTDNIQIFRFARVPFGINCSPFLLGSTIRTHLQTYNTTVSKTIQKNHYVDNVITGASSLKKAQEYYLQAKAIFKEASMNLTQWSSNCNEFLASIPEADRATSISVKVLGLCWNTNSDRISITGPDPSDFRSSLTRRSLLKLIASVFDPLGYVAPVLLDGKVLIQQITQKKFGWDDKIGPIHNDSVKTISNQIAGISDISIPRYAMSATGSITLLCFCDASKRAYATTIYLRCQYNETVSCNLIFAKSRLNPVKPLSIPKLEVMGVLIGIRALKFVHQIINIQVESTTLLSDSQCVLRWINEAPRSDRWVTNRIKEIHGFGPVSFRYVSTTENPADWATRGKQASELNEFWWNGPAWLKLPDESWPHWDFPMLDINHMELKPKRQAVLHEFSVVAESRQPEAPFGIDIQAHSSLMKLLRVTAYCRRFVNILKASIGKKSICLMSQKSLSADEIKDAKTMWIKSIQSQEYNEVITSICNGKKHELIHLGIRFDDAGLLVCCGRLGNADLPSTAKVPILLPKRHPFSDLVILHCHCKTKHSGISQTLAILRMEYWIPSGRTRCRTVLKKCRTCLRYQGNPYPLPNMPELPVSRVTPQPAFSYTGVDYFGPLRVKNGSVVEKVWVALFTCLTVRAVHLEIVTDMTAEEFLSAIRRFIARRGKPSMIICDNAPQFKTAGNVISQAWKTVISDPDILNYCSNEAIRWSYITEYTPWQGGIYERVVGLVKQPLRKALGRALLSLAQLTTLMCEVEAIVNSRPLTYVSNDVDNVIILTPSHFLMLNPRTGTPNIVNTNTSASNQKIIAGIETNTSQRVIDLWRKGQNLLNEFWKLWVTDYLLSLRERMSYSHNNGRSSISEPAIGHIVVIKDQLLPRGAWKIGRIVDLRRRSDNAIHSAVVKLPSSKTICMPINHLFPLELGDSEPAAQPTLPQKTMPDTANDEVATLQQYPSTAEESDGDEIEY